jgi:hypothetical protein
MRESEKEHVMDMTSYLPAKFYRISDVESGPVTETILRVDRSDRFDKAEITFESGNVLTLSSTNVAVLVKAFGADSDAWAKKTIELYLGQVPFKGEMTDSVLVRPVSPPVPAEERKAPPPRRSLRGDLDHEVEF